MWGEILGGGLGLLGSLLGGDAAESQGAANRDNMMALLNKQYGWGNDARMRMAGELYGDGGLQYLFNTSRPEDFNSFFGKNAAENFGKPAQQRSGGQNNSSDPGQAFARTIGGRQALDAFRDNGFHNWFAQQYGRWPNPSEVQAAYDSVKNGSGLGNNANSAGDGEYDSTQVDKFKSQYGGKRGIIGQLEDLGTWAEGQGNNVLNDYNSGMASVLKGYDDSVNTAKDTRQTDAMAAGLEDMAGQWGRGRDKIIEQDAERARAGADQRAIGRLGAMGFGNSSLVGNQLASNAMESNRNVARAKQDLGEAQIDRQMGARQYRTNLADSNLSRLLGVMGQRNAAAGGMQQGRTAIQSDNLNRNMQLRQQPINTNLAMLQSPLMNPGSGINASSYFTPSGAGGMQSAFGGFLGNMGGQIFGQSQLQDLMKMIGK